jgi:hemerythrin superfamily protein
MGAIGKFFKGFEEKPAPESHDAVEMLKADHRRVKSLVGQFEKAKNGSEKQELLGTIIKELAAHTTLEEELVYPLLDAVDHEGAEVAVEEHHVVKLVLEELSNMSAEAELVATKVKILWELVEHHVEEEEDELFPKLRKSGEDMQELGQRLAQRKQQLIRPPSARGRQQTRPAEKTVRTSKRTKGSQRKGTAARARQAS